MGSTPPATRERLITAARRLFAEKGYQATTTGEIAREARANPGSLYFFFPTKQQLLVAVLERYRDGIEEMLLRPAWNGITDPVEKIFALLERYRGFLVDSDCSYGCPIGSLALELHDPDPDVRKSLAANFDAWTHAVERCLEEVRDRLPGATAPRDLATFVLTTMEGAVMQSRTYRDAAAFDTSIRVLRDYFARVLSPAAAPQTPF